MAVSINGRSFCTDSNKIDEPFKVEEAETVPPPPTEKVLSYNHASIFGCCCWCVCVCMALLTYKLCICVLSVVEVACAGRQWICWITCL